MRLCDIYEVIDSSSGLVESTMQSIGSAIELKDDEQTITPNNHMMISVKRLVQFKMIFTTVLQGCITTGNSFSTGGSVERPQHILVSMYSQVGHLSD